MAIPALSHQGKYEKYWSEEESISHIKSASVLFINSSVSLFIPPYSRLSKGFPLSLIETVLNFSLVVASLWPVDPTDQAYVRQAYDKLYWGLVLSGSSWAHYMCKVYYSGTNAMIKGPKKLRFSIRNQKKILHQLDHPDFIWCLSFELLGEKSAQYMTATNFKFVLIHSHVTDFWSLAHKQNNQCLVSTWKTMNSLLTGILLGTKRVVLI